MANQSTVLGEYNSIQQEKKKAKTKRMVLIVALAVVFVAAAIGGWYYFYNHSTLSWNDEQWYEHARSVLNDNRKAVNYWSVSGDCYLKDAGLDYDKSCMESFHFYVSREDHAISVDFTNSCYDSDRVDYDHSQYYEYTTDGAIYALSYNHEQQYISKIKPSFIDEWEKEYTLDRIFIPELEKAEIVYSYKEGHSDDIYAEVDPDDLPKDLYDGIMKSMFGDEFDINNTIVSRCEISFSIDHDQIESWGILVKARDTYTGTVEYSRSYYLSYDDSYIYMPDSGDIVTDWAECEAVKQMLPITNRIEGKVENGGTDL